MITYFSMEGFLSIKDPIEIYFIPRPGTRLKNTRFADNFLGSAKYRLAKSILLFGLNASGKSNVLTGLSHLTDIIKNGLNLAAIDNARRKLINLDSQSAAFTLGLYDVKSDREYVYTLRYDDHSILNEKLQIDDQTIYSFDNNKLSISDEQDIANRDAIIQLMSRPSSELLLFKLNDYLTPQITSFRSVVNKIICNVRNPHLNINRNAARNIPEEMKSFWEQNHDSILTVFQMLDSTITDFILIPYPTHSYELVLCRGKKPFPLGIESQGLQKICEIVDAFIDTMIHGNTLLLDELDSSISTQCLLTLFNDLIHTDFNKGQFFMTSHNPLLMNQDLFHPQQLYIVNKKPDLSTEVYSLDDFDLRADKAKLYEDYLKGRFHITHV